MGVEPMRIGKALITAIFLIAAAVLTATMFILIPDRNSTFYISYAFTLMALAAGYVNSLMLSDAGPANLPQDMALLHTALIYLAVEVVISIGAVAMELANGPERTLNHLTYTLVHFIVLGFFSIRFILLMMGKRHIDAVPDKARQGVMNVRMLCADIAALREKASMVDVRIRGSVLEDLDRLYEAVRHSDPMSNPGVRATEERIQEDIRRLAVIVDSILIAPDTGADEFTGEVGSILAMIKDRNNRVRLSK